MNHIALSGFLLSLPKIYGKSEADYDDLATNSVCKQADPISEETNREEGYSHGAATNGNSSTAQSMDIIQKFDFVGVFA